MGRAAVYRSTDPEHPLPSGNCWYDKQGHYGNALLCLQPLQPQPFAAFRPPPHQAAHANRADTQLLTNTCNCNELSFQPTAETGSKNVLNPHMSEASAKADSWEAAIGTKTLYLQMPCA